MRLAFDSLSLVIQHLIEQYKPFENPQLIKALLNANKRCEQLKDNLDAKNSELNDMKIIFEEQINQLMKEREKNFSDLNQAKVNHEANVKKLTEMHSWEVKTLKDKHNKELQMCQQNRDQLLNEIKGKNDELNQTKQLKDELQVKIIQMEENIMNDKDKRFKYLTEKTKQQELEVESLKVVMDMKNEKIHTLERQMIETQEKINELPLAKETIRGLQQQIENLQVTLERKIHQFNQLTAEHEDLKTEYDRELREKRRLSMKNEELAFHLSESFNSESGFNNCTNYDSNHKHWRSGTLITDETPIKTNRAFIASASNSTSIRKTHSKPIKSMSSSLSSANSKRGTPALYCHSSNFAFENESSFLSNGTADEVFGNTYKESNLNPNSGKKSDKCQLFTSSDETPPQCILDSGFEEIQGLNSLPK
jgi:myosin heavy subunit